MKNIIRTLMVSSIALSMTACSFFDVNVESTAVSYVYIQDINDSKRYNSGSDYMVNYPFQPDRKMLTIDYGTSVQPFKATYTLPTAQKISIEVNAEIIYQLKRNPKDEQNNLPYRQDEYAQFFAKNIKPKQTSSDYYLIDGETVYNKMMAEHEDLAFRAVFNDSTTYTSFDVVESNIQKIQQQVKESLTEKAKNSYIEIIGVRIKDIPVPQEIADGRKKALTLQQDAANKLAEIDNELKIMAKKTAVDARKAMNDVIVDKLVSSQVDKSYMLLEIFREAAANDSPFNVSFTPDFMKYVESDNSKREIDPESSELFNKLNAMSEQELANYFQNKK